MREWTDEEKKDVKDLLESGSGAEEVCAVMDCARKDLDHLCKAAFGLDFASTDRKYKLVGLAKLRASVYRSALDKNTKAQDMCMRTLGNYDPISTHGKAKSVPSKPEKKLEL